MSAQCKAAAVTDFFLATTAGGYGSRAFASDDTIILASTARRQKQKARAHRPGFSDAKTLPDQAAGLNSFDALALIGSTVSVATF